MSPSGSRYGPLVGSIDEGTSSVRFLVSNIILEILYILFSY